MKKLITIAIGVIIGFSCPLIGYDSIFGKVSGIDTETGVEITGLNTSEFKSGSLVVYDSENFKTKLAKAGESYDNEQVIAMVIYQHPDSGIIKIFTKSQR